MLDAIEKMIRGLSDCIFGEKDSLQVTLFTQAGPFRLINIALISICCILTK
jgi:hypothetical protein